MRYLVLLAVVCLALTGCGGPTKDQLNPPDAPVIPPGRSSENPGAPAQPGVPPMNTIPAR